MVREILGHSSVTVTERYAHLRPDLFWPEDLIKLSVPMSRDGGTVHDLAAVREECGRVATPWQPRTLALGTERM